MIKLPTETVMLFTDDEIKAQYIKSRVFYLKTLVKKTSKRTGLSTAEISTHVNQKKVKSYLDNLMTFKRFKKQGDIRQATLDSIIKKMVAIPSK